MCGLVSSRTDEEDRPLDVHERVDHGTVHGVDCDLDRGVLQTGA